MADIELEVVYETSVVELEVVEAQVKPEVIGQVTPAYEPQTVTPPAGSVFSAVEVGAIQDQTVYDGEVLVVPSTTDDQVLETRDKIMPDDVIIKKIQHVEVSNDAGGYTFIINS